jgi:hypothetical protein
MNSGDRTGDLLVLVADSDMEQTVKGLLARPESLEMAPVKAEVHRHLRRDSGCRTGAVEYLRRFLNRYRHALVIFDLHGSGSHGSREETGHEVGSALSRNGWGRRAKAIVVEPELEAWVWADSKHVPRVLGWSKGYAELRRWLRGQELWPNGSSKPLDPKEAMIQAMRKSGSPRSSQKYFDLASTVSVRRCQDPSFNDFRQTLQSWFPAEPNQ